MYFHFTVIIVIVNAIAFIIIIIFFIYLFKWKFDCSTKREREREREREYQNIKDIVQYLCGSARKTRQMSMLACRESTRDTIEKKRDDGSKIIS